MRYMLPAIAMILLPGCVVSTATKVVTAPVKAGAKAADWATTSQDEADRARGREMRKAEERDRKAEKKRRKQQREACRDAGYSDC